MVLVALPAVTWQELRHADLPNLHSLMEQGAVGLMPVPPEDGADPRRAWASISAGRRAVGGPESLPVEPREGGGVEVSLAPVIAANRAAHIDANVSAFGEALRLLGLSRAVVIAGSRSTYHPALLALADNRGRVDGVYAVDSHSPRECSQVLEQALAEHDVVLAACERGDALSTADVLAGAAREMLDGGPLLLIVFAPASPGGNEPDVRTMGPVIVYDSEGETARGLLTSRATHRRGIITAPDLAAAVLAWWGRRRETAATEGIALWALLNADSAAKAVAAPNGLAELDALDTLLTDRYRLRVVVAKWYAVFGLVVIALGLGLAAGRPQTGRTQRRAWAPYFAQGLRMAGSPPYNTAAGGLALALALVPAGLVAAAAVPPGRDALHLLVTGLAAGALAWAAVKARRVERGLAISLLLGAGAIVADVVSGSRLIERAALEIGVMNGLRFYGISNPIMGGVVGMAVIGMGALAEWRPRAAWLAWPVGVMVVLAMGAPFWGANVGGAVTAAAGFAALWVLTRRRVRGWHVAAAAGIALAGAFSPAVIDSLMPEAARTHIGGGAAALLSGRVDLVVDIAARKLARNYAILRVAFWSPLAAALCGLVFWGLLRRGGRARAALEGRRSLSAGIWAALIAGVVAMVVNDSGVAAGFGAIFAALGTVVFIAAWEADS